MRKWVMAVIPFWVVMRWAFKKLPSEYWASINDDVVQIYSGTHRKSLIISTKLEKNPFHPLFLLSPFAIMLLSQLLGKRLRKNNYFYYELIPGVKWINKVIY